MGFNAENGENRKFILCTNNEITKENPMPPSMLYSSSKT